MIYNPKDNPILVKCKSHTTLPIDMLLEFQGNLKRLTKQNREKLIGSICERGFIAPIFVWDDAGDYRLLDGHQRLKTLLWMREKGWDIPMLPVDIIDAEDEQDAKKKLLAITSQYGEFDTNGFTEFLDSLNDGFDFDNIRLVDGELDVSKLIKEEKTIGDDEAPEVPDEAVSQLGKIYELGPHRLMCGDSTDAEQVAILMGDELADAWITDPPYNVNYEGKTKDALKMDNDQMSDDKFRAFLVSAFSAAKDFMKPGAAFYIWHADSEGYNFRGACHDIGLQVRQCLIWNKQSMVMGRQDYHWKHEPCLYGWKDGAAHLWAADRKQTTVLNFDRPSMNKEHPTMKPVELFSYCILNNTRGGDIILDTFGGSGTSIISSAKTDRQCRMMELNPVYCDVIRRRWTKWARENGHKVGKGLLE